MSEPKKRPSLRVTGYVDEATGKFKPDDPVAFKMAFLYYRGKRVELEPVPEGERRTAAQNARWHAALVPVWRAFFIANGDIDEDASQSYVHHRAVAIMTGRHTSKGMTRQEFAYLMNQSELFLNERGYTLPAYTPDNDDAPPEGME